MKVIKQHIKKAILLYEDPDTGQPRRVIFGEMPQLISLLISEMPIIMERIEQMSGEKFKSPMEFFTYYLAHKEKWIKLKGIEAGDNMELNLNYEVKKL